MKILGIAAFYHDSSATLVVDGKIVSAFQEERFTRIKHDANFPIHSIKLCLKDNGLRPSDIDHIVFYEKPFLKFERLLETYLAFAPKGFSSFCKAIPLWLDEKLFQKRTLKEQLIELGFSKEQCKTILFSEHHLSHAASAYYPSPFDSAIVLTMDGVGEWETTTVYLGKGNKLEKKKELAFPHSLGLLYSAFTYYCGFKVNSGEYKLMGLAPYGKPVFKDLILSTLIDVKEDGSFRMNMKYFNYCTGLTMTNKHFDDLFGHPVRKPDDQLSSFYMNIAASIQAVLEEVVIKMCLSLKKEFGIKNLCLAGGVALNCVANGKLSQMGLFESIWIQPASGDAGGSLGAALAVHYLNFNYPRTVENEDGMQGAFLGNQYQEDEVEQAFKEAGLSYTKMTKEEIFQRTAKELANEQVVGWFQGRMEFGPRALGNRSILADARSEKMQKNLNLKIKFRESFRPFAPVVLKEEANNFFDLKEPSPYMLVTALVKKEKQLSLKEHEENLEGIEKLKVKRSEIPAVTHVDFSARIQTVGQETNLNLYKLLHSFKTETGCPVLINTSFNVRGEPIVCTPQDAIKCFMGTDIDVLVVENFIALKKNQPHNLKNNYRLNFAMD